MLHVPFYDPTKSYEKNYTEGPFGPFESPKKYNQVGEPIHDYHGHKVYLPFGIPPGPLINSAFIKSAFQMGFDICVYKTVRSDSFPCHPHPNILALDIRGDIASGKSKPTYLGRPQYTEPLSITNSFGVPSKSVDFWQNDVRQALEYAGKGQVLVLSFMGTVRKNQTDQQFIDDHKLVAEKALETGAKLLEVNLSCPNLGDEGLICYNIESSRKILKAIREVIGRTPLTVKMGYFDDEKELLKFVQAVQEYVQGIASINTMPAKVVDKEGNQALPGPNRLTSGICGSSIKWAGLKTAQRLASIKKKYGYMFVIESMGGVMNASDYGEYRKVGADVVMSATGAMWNPFLAQEIKKVNKNRK